MTRTRLFTLIALVSLFTSSFAGDEHAWHAHYLANAGVMIARADTKILFDPFFRNDYGRYDLVPRETEAEVFAGSSPWDGVDAIFISHRHSDHFDPEAIRGFLHRWPDVRLYAPEQAAEAVLEVTETPGESLSNRVNGIKLEHDSPAVQLEMDGLVIEAVRVPHAGWPDRHADVENIVFRVTLDEASTVMHLGDADAGSEHYTAHESHWQARETDLAMVPVWLMLTDKGRYVLDEHIDAEHDIGVHVYKSIPDDPEDRPPEFDGLDLFTEPGEIRHFD
ncbi:MAG: MBL fold metallo-hydrolase [Woeseiaceae bacterium]|nr:MBL fold metallo-hydrolase [Woeseiaceae bacterium]